MDLLAGIAMLTLVVASATIVALEAVLGRTPSPTPVVVRHQPAHARGRAAHPAGHARRV
jgi:hypothetical protein